MRNPALLRPIRILIADGHPLFRLGIRTLLQQPDLARFEIVGEVAEGDALVAEAARLQPDLVLLEVNLPGLHGIEATRQILRILPKTRILALASANDNQSVSGMVRAGAAGYLVKTIPLPELISAIAVIIEGNTYFSRDAAAAFLASAGDKRAEAFSPPSPASTDSHLLTKRELEILHFVAEEKSNQEIARMLYLSPRTVETHKRNMLLKLKMRNVAGLVRYYLQTVRPTAYPV